MSPRAWRSYGGWLASSKRGSRMEDRGSRNGALILAGMAFCFLDPLFWILVLNDSVDQHILPKLVELPFGHGQSFGDLVDAHPANGRFGGVAPGQSRRYKDMNFVHGAGIEETTENGRTSFHQDVRHPPSTQFIQQRLNP